MSTLRLFLIVCLLAMHLPFALLDRQDGSSIITAPLVSNETNPTSTEQTFPSPSPTPGSSTGTQDGGLNTNITNPIIGVIAGVVVLIVAFYTLKYLRRTYENPKYIPTSYLKRKWSSWTPSGLGAYRSSSDHLEPISGQSSRNRTSQPPISFDAATANAVRRAEGGETIGVDRNTSVRSVMTLPAYNPKAGETEQVLGREGERGGIDVVIEYPESAAEAESMRDQEMDALYQVRLARRTEAAEREERRRLRREARERNDFVALRELRADARSSNAAAGERTLEELREDHARLRDRQRAVSSVSYGDLGVARHDGTRIRANSEESERPLLGDTASIAASSQHRRDRSASSVLSVDSDFPSPGLSRRSRADSGAASQRRTSGVSGISGVSTAGAMSSPEIIDRTDLGEDDVPSRSPPEYEHIILDDATDNYPEAPPDYQSPVHELRNAAEDGFRRREAAGSRTTRGVGGVPQLPSLRLTTLPSIVVNTPTPVNPRRTRDEDVAAEHATLPADGV